MPAKDKTGPTGQGSRTGRGMGNCQPTKISRFFSGKSMGGRFSRGLGRRFGLGRRGVAQQK